MAISGVDMSKFDGEELPDIAGYKTAIAEKSEKKSEKDGKDFKGKKTLKEKRLF